MLIEAARGCEDLAVVTDCTRKRNGGLGILPLCLDELLVNIWYGMLHSATFCCQRGCSLAEGQVLVKMSSLEMAYMRESDSG
jgi:hypothetical protein